MKSSLAVVRVATVPTFPIDAPNLGTPKQLNDSDIQLVITLPTVKPGNTPITSAPIRVVYGTARAKADGSSVFTDEPHFSDVAEKSFEILPINGVFTPPALTVIVPVLELSTPQDIAAFVEY